MSEPLSGSGTAAALGGATVFGLFTGTDFGIVFGAFAGAYFHERRSLNNFHRDRVITFEQIAE